jgi:hypothetical protein
VVVLAIFYCHRWLFFVRLGYTFCEAAKQLRGNHVALTTYPELLRRRKNSNFLYKKSRQIFTLGSFFCQFVTGGLSVHINNNTPFDLSFQNSLTQIGQV